MADTAKIAGDKPANDEKPLVSKGIYAAGHSFKDGLIWGLLATIASFGILAVGRARPGMPENLIDKAAGKLEKGHGNIKGWIATGVKRTAKVLFNKDINETHVTGPAITATAFLIGTIVAHIVQIPAAVRGWTQASQLNAEHDRLKKERNQLVRVNADLIAENSQLKAGVQERGSSTEVIKETTSAPAEVAEPDAGQPASFARKELEKRPLAETHAEKIAKRDEAAAQTSMAM